MEGVSGITGAGPLLHRAALRVATRYRPGVLPSPEQLGARPVTICRLSGMAATRYCPRDTEWFLPGTEPSGAPCDWHGTDGRVRLPAEFALWASAPAPAAIRGTGQSPRRQAGAETPGRFRIASPAEGDHYRFVPGVAARYSTIALRAVGMPGAARVRWTLDGRPLAGARWAMVPGRHVLRAEAGPFADEVRFTVEAPQ
jgi:penicillin-binding protein 1C